MYCGIKHGEFKSLRQYLGIHNVKISNSDITQDLNQQLSNGQDIHLASISRSILKDPLKVVYLFHCFQEAPDDRLCDIL